MFFQHENFALSSIGTEGKVGLDKYPETVNPPEHEGRFIIHLATVMHGSNEDFKKMILAIYLNTVAW